MFKETVGKRKEISQREREQEKVAEVIRIKKHTHAKVLELIVLN